MNQPKILYEPEDDILNIWFSKKPIDYGQQFGDVIVHFTKDHEPVYLEILDGSKFFKRTSQAFPAKFKVTSQSAVAHRIK